MIRTVLLAVLVVLASMNLYLSYVKPSCPCSCQKECCK